MESPSSLIRSSSAATVSPILTSPTTQTVSVRSLSANDNGLQEKDYVVVDGKKYRVNRSSQVTGKTINNGDKEVTELKQTLESTTVLLTQQEELIRKQAKKIEKLEILLKNATDALTHQKERSNIDSGGTTTSEQSEDLSWHSPSARCKNGSRGGSRGASASRRRDEALESAKLHSLPSPETDKSPHSSSGCTSHPTRSSVDSIVNCAEDWTTVSSVDKATTNGSDIARSNTVPPTIVAAMQSSKEKSQLLLFSSSPEEKRQTTSSSSSSSNATSPSESSSTYSEIVSDVSTSPPLISAESEHTHSPLTVGTGSGSVPPKGLAARLAMGSQERRRLAAMGGARSAGSRVPTRPPVSPRSASAGTATSVTAALPHVITADNDGTSAPARSLECEYVLDGPSPTTSPCAPFMWQAAATKGEVFLFIAHDNPQVGATVATRLKTEGNMHIMLESKEDSGLVCFLLASIVYSGRIEGVEGAELHTPRGSQFIVCGKMVAYKGDIKAFPSRVRGDISEIDLDGCGPEGRIDVSAVDNVTSYLRGCSSRVDVILDPSHSQLWYPYWEGRRKMAPQFRSQGVGYLRLGDDMSRYGSAFLSLDAGMTFMDDGATSIVPSSTTLISPMFRLNHPEGGFGPSSSSPLSSSTPLTHDTNRSTSVSRQRGAGRRKLSIDSTTSDDEGGEGFAVNTPHNNGIHNVPVLVRSKSDLNKDLEELRETLQLLSGTECKWAERVEALRRMYNAISNITMSSSPPTPGSSGSGSTCTDIPESLLTEIISVLNISITKQKNPHVLRSAVCCIRVVGGCAAGTASCGVAWRTLLLEIIHLLRSSTKAVYEEAKDTLLSLHSSIVVPGGGGAVVKGTISLSNLTPMLPDVLAGPRGKGSSGASSTAKVVQWLETLVATELDSHIRSLGSGGVVKQVYDRVDVAGTMQKVHHLWAHREEASREAAVTLGGALLTFELVQQAGASGGGGWDGLCALADIVALPARTAHKPIVAPSSATGPRSRSSTPVRTASTDSSDVSPAAIDAILAAIGTAATAAIGEVSKANSRMHERLLASTIQWLTTKIAEERQRATVKVTDNKHISPVHAAVTTAVTAASPSPSNAGIAFRGDRGGVNTTGGVVSTNTSGPNSASGGVNTHTPSSGRATGDTPGSGRARNTSFDFVLNTELEMEATPSPETKDNRDQPATPGDSALSSLRRSRSSPLPADTIAIRSSPIAGNSPARQPITPHSTNPNDSNSSNSNNHSPLNLSYSPQQAATTLSKLSGDWFEVRLILKNVPSTGEGWSTFSQVVKSAPTFYQQLNAAAKAGGIPRAALLRVVLPFDEDTSSSDQAHVDSRRRPVGTTSSPSSSSSPQREPASVAGVDDHTLTMLQQQAVVLRKLIRIKMADEADLQQAQSATTLLQRFCIATEALASQQGSSPQSLVVGFEREMMM